MSTKPLQILYNSLRDNNYDVPDNYDSFERTLTASGAEGVRNRQLLYKSLKDNNYDVPQDYQSFANTLFKPAKQVDSGNRKQTKQSNYKSGSTKAQANSLAQLSGYATHPNRRVVNTEPEVKQNFRPTMPMGRIGEPLPDLLSGIPSPFKPIEDPNAYGEHIRDWSEIKQEQDERMRGIDNIRQQADKGLERANEAVRDVAKLNNLYASQNMLELDGMDRGALGDNPNVHRGDLTYDQSKGKFVRKYVDTAGNTYDYKTQANDEQDRMDAIAWIKQHPEEHTRQQLDRLNENVTNAYDNYRRYKQSAFTYSPYYGGGVGMSSSAKNDLEWQTLSTAKYALDDAYKTIREAETAAKTDKFLEWMDSNWAGSAVKGALEFTAGAGRGAMDKLFDVRTWLDGATVNEQRAIKAALDAADKGTLTKEQKMLLDAEAMKLSVDAVFGSQVGYGYTSGGIAAESLPFMLEFAINPASAAGKTIGSRIARYALKKLGKGALNRVMKMATKIGARTAGNIAAAAAMTSTTSMPRVLTGAQQRQNGDIKYTYDANNNIVYGGHTQGDNMLTAYGKSYLDTFIDNFTEMGGSAFSKGAKVATKTGRMLTKMDKFVNLVKDFEKRTQWHGPIEEYLEEVAANIMNAATVGDMTFDTAKDTGVFNPKLNLQTFAGVVITGGVISGMKTAGYRSPKKRAAAAMKEADDGALQVFGNGTKWRSIRNSIAFGSDEDAVDTLFKLCSDKNTTPQQRAAALEYAKSALYYKGVLKGEAERATDTKARMLDEAYGTGYKMKDVSNMRTAKLRLDTLRNRLSEFVADDKIRQFDSEPLIALHTIKDNEQWSQEEKQDAIDYVNAKAVYDGMIQAVRDDINSQIAASDEIIDNRIASEEVGGDGMIHPATLKADNKQVYIISGNVVTLADGTIDVENSDNDLIIVDENGVRDFTSVNKLRSVDAVMDAEQMKQEAADNIRESVSNTAAAKIDGSLSFLPNDVYEVVGEDGQPHKVQVLQQIDEDNVSVVVDGQVEKPVTMSKEEVQDMYDAKRRSNLKQERDAEERDPFALYADVTIKTPDGDVKGTIVTAENEDGLIEVETDVPINGKMVNLFTRDELDKLTQQEQGDENTSDEVDIENFQPTGKSILGNLYNQFKGKSKAAINFLLKRKEGNAVAALHHKDVGDIDLWYGNDKAGLKKIAEKHPEVLEDLQGIIDGMRVVQASENRVILESDTHKAVISKMLGNEKTDNWLLSAYEKKDISGGSSDIGPEPEGKQNGTAPLLNELSAGKDSKNSDTNQTNNQENADDVLVERLSNHTPESAQGFINNNVESLNKELAKAKKKKSKATDFDEYERETAENEAEVQRLEAELERWNTIQQRVNDIANEKKAAAQAEQKAKDKQLHDEAVKAEEQRIEEEQKKQEEREAVGANNIAQSIRDKWNNVDKVVGNKDEIVLPDGTALKGHYVLHESGASSPSHDALNGFAKTEGFPFDENEQTVNDRDYERDQDAQGITKQMSDNYDSRAIQTPVVVSKDGVVLSGNGRTMAGVLAAKNNTDSAYIDYLKEYANKYGFTPEQVGSMQHPRVSFVPDADMPYTAETFAKFNQQDMKSQSKTEQAVKLGKVVSDGAFSRIIRLINGYDTLGEFYADNKATRDALSELLKDGAFNQMQYTEMFDGDSISVQGRDMLENMLIGKAFEALPDAVRQITTYKSIRQAVVTALAELSNNIALGDDYQISDEIIQAINLVYQARGKGYNYGDRVSDFARQLNLFPNEDGESVADYNNALVMLLSDILNDKRVTRLKKFLELYNHNAALSAAGQLDIFTGDVKTKEDIIKEVLQLLDYGTEEEQQQASAEAREQRKQSVANTQGESSEEVSNSNESNEGDESKGKLIETSSANKQEKGGKTYDFTNETEEEWKEFEKGVKNMSDEELLNVIRAQGFDENKANHMSVYDEYDARHGGEEVDYFDTCMNALNDGSMSREDVENMLANTEREWRDGGFASDLRTQLNAQIDAYNEWLQVHPELTKDNITDYKGLTFSRVRDNGQVDMVEITDVKDGNVEYLTNGKAHTTPINEFINALSMSWQLGRMYGSFDSVLPTEQVNEQNVDETKGETVSKKKDVTDIRLRKLKAGEMCHVERRYIENGGFSFTGGEKIESMDDVAYIFKQLENAAIENSFIALIKNGKATVIHVGTGAYAATIANVDQAFAAYKELKPEKVYFVHNHPSGALRASRQDAEILGTAKSIFGDAMQPGIIIDTTSGKYGVYDQNGTSREQAMIDGVGNEIPIKTYSFSKQVFSEDWNPDKEMGIVSPESIAAFVSSHRLGQHKKMSFLVLNQQNAVTANLFLPYTKLSEAKPRVLADMLSKYIHLAGGVKGVLYGNYELDEPSKPVMETLSFHMRQLKTPLLDVIHIDRSAHEEGRLREPEVKYHKASEGVPVYYSNAQRAVEGIKQEKATPEQWLKMIEKAGGLKAGEDKWLGLSDFLMSEHDKKTLTKDEVLDFIRENMIQIEEVEYGENRKAPQEIYDKFNEYLEDELSRTGRAQMEDAADNAWGRMRNEYGDDIDIAFTLWYNKNEKRYEIDIDNAAAAESLVDIPFTPINSTRLAYTTERLQNKREIALTVPTIESWNEDDEIHFGDAGEGRAVAWVRFGDTTDEDGNKVLVIDEIQSKRHQEGREEGYMEKDRQIKIDRYEELESKSYSEEGLTDEEYREMKALEEEGVAENKSGVPAAPFEKNWMELAMKRMLRYAAENGYDKVAWTTGEQQAERYDLSKAVEKIDIHTVKRDGKDVKMVNLKFPERGQSAMYVSEDGIISQANGLMENANGKHVSEVFGKSLAEKIMNTEWETIEGEGLRIGGEGMKGFYDKMLPSFMNKYGKKWGVKVGEVTLPNVEESARKMWSVDVTPEMKESVMQGQPMFLRGGAVQLTPQEVALRDAIVDLMDSYGLRVITDDVMGQSVIDYVNGEDTPLSKAQKRAVETATLSDNTDAPLTVVSTADGAKILNNLNELANHYDNLTKNNAKTFLGKVAKALEAKNHGSNSQYATFETKNGQIVTIRLANHNTKVSTFDNHNEDNGISIVVSHRANQGITNDGQAHVVEYYYSETGLRRVNGKPLADIVRAIQQSLYSGEFKDPTGIAERQEVNEDNIREMRNNARFFRTPEGEVYGFTYKGDIYIDPRVATAETPIHEYAHLWVGALKKANPKAWETLKKRMEGMSDVMEYVKGLYPELEGDDLLEEVFTHYSGRRGAERLREEQKAQTDAAEGIFNKASVIAMFEKLRGLLKDFWNKARDLFAGKVEGVEDMSGEDFADMMLGDLLGGFIPDGGGDKAKYARERWANTGYTERADGTSLSVRADNAEYDGKFTKGTFRNRYEVSAKSFDVLTDLGVIKNTEWHHTGKSFKQSDYYAWADFDDKDYTEGTVEEGSLGDKYIENKKEIDRLSKELDSRDWKYENEQELEYVPTEEDYLDGTYNATRYTYLTDSEEEERRKEHNKISNAGDNIGTSYERLLMHEAIDAKYEELRRKRFDERKEDLLKEFRSKNAEIIRKNEETKKANAEQKERNKSTDGKENILYDIVRLLGFDEEQSYKIVERLSRRERAEIIKEEEEARRKERSLEYAEQAKKLADRRKKWVKSKIADGSIVYRERISTKPDLFMTEIEEMNGRYGWFEASSRYNLPRYYSGYEFKDKRTYNKFHSFDKEFGEILNKAVDNDAYSPLIGDNYSNRTINENVLYRDGKSIEDVNDRFNEELQKQIDGELPANHIYNIGRPSDILLSTGIPNVPIELVASRLVDKSMQENHPFELKEVENLPASIYNPLAVFRSATHVGSFVILTELKHGGRSFVAAIEANKQVGKLIVNSIRSVHYRTGLNIVNWINEDLGEYYTPGFIAKWLSPLKNELRSKPQYNSVDVRTKLNSAAKVIENFENPKISTENFREGDDTPYMDYEEKLKDSRRRGYTKQQLDRSIERHVRLMRERAEETVGKLGIADNVTILEDNTGLEGRKAKAKGWYDTESGKIVVVLGNHGGVSDVVKTILHEGVAHRGLRELFGENFNTFLDNVYKHGSEEVKQRIDELAKKYDGDIRTATEEYLAELAESTDFERPDLQSWWRQIKRWFLDMLDKVGLKEFDGELSDNELRYILWRSYENLAEPNRYNNVFATAKDIAKQYELGVGNFAAESMVSEEEQEQRENNILFRDDNFSPRDRQTAREVYNDIVASGRFQFQEAMQDSMLGLKELYKAILGKGTKIEDVAGNENAYLAENRMSSVNTAEQHLYFTQVMSPLLKAVYELVGEDGVARKELTDYMMAKHGLERNQKFAERDALEAKTKGKDYNGELQKNRKRDYAGLTALTGMDDVRDAEAEAQRIVDNYESLHDTTALWQRVKDATQTTLAKLYKGGIFGKNEYDNIRQMFDYYIPLRGWDEKTSDEVYGYLTSRNGFGGSIAKKAKGRSSKADDPIATIAFMADAAIRQANRNLMKQRFLTFVQNNPSDLVSVNKLWLQYNDVSGEWEPVFADIKAEDTAEVVDDKVAAFEDRMKKLAEQNPDKYKRGADTKNIPYRVLNNNLREHQVLVKRNGETYVLTINGNPRAAQALNGLTNPDVEVNDAVGTILKAFEWLNRQLSAMYTTRNPDFVASNFFRDMLYSNCMTWVKESPKYAIAFNTNFTLVNPMVMLNLFRKWEGGKLNENNKIEKLFGQFMANGGETGFTTVKDIEAHKRSIANELKRQSNALRQFSDVMGMQFDIVNKSVENCARFAAFVTSRDFGRSIERSIYDAKEVSVNFNKKGAGDKMMNAVGQTFFGKYGGSFISGMGRLAFVFWNAGIQGMTNFGRAGAEHPLKASVAATTLFALGAAMPYIAMLMSGGDDDDKNAYYNLPEYIRRSNICINAGDQWITIPLPIEFRAVYGLGELAYGVLARKERYSDGELAKQVLSQVSQLLPIDFMEGGGGWQAFIPSAIKPLYEAGANTSWTGLPIYKENPFNENEPEYTQVYKNTDKYLVAVSKYLNELSGGDDVSKGWLDVVNPAQVEYVLNGYFGGFFKVPTQLVKMVETAVGERDFDWRNMIIANRLLKTGDERTEARKLTEEYFKYSDELKKFKHNLKGYERDADSNPKHKRALEFLKKSEDYKMYEVFENYKPLFDAYHKAKQGQKDDRVRAIEQEENILRREMVDLMHAIEDDKNPNIDKSVDDMLKREFEYGGIPQKSAGQTIAKRLGGTDSYGNAKGGYSLIYNRMRDYTDLAQDVILQTEEKKAKESGDTERAKRIAAARRDITAIKKDLAELPFMLDDGTEVTVDDVMETLRDVRNEYLQELGINKGNR